MIMSEVYRLWAIETADARTIQLLSFSQADNGVVIAPKIDRFRELKLRLLNGSHTFSCALAVAMGFSTVRQAMENELFYHFISTLMLHEIVPAITGDAISAADAQQFAAAVLDRYKNPFIEHQWLAIALQYSSKMKMRNVPLLQQYYQKKAAVPRYMAMGFAAYGLFMKTVKHQGQPFTGRAGGREYVVHDDKAADLYQLWLTGNTDNFVQHLLQSEALWNARLDTLPGFETAVASNITAIEQYGAVQALKQMVAGNE